MTTTRRTRRIAAPAPIVWPALANVALWPEFIDPVEEVRPLDGAALKPGARFEVRQKGVRRTVWTVTELEPSRRFAWEAEAGGVSLRADHRMAPDGPRATLLTIEFALTGALGRAAAMLMRGKTERFIEAELDGVQARAEARRQVTAGV